MVCIVGTQLSVIIFCSKTSDFPLQGLKLKVQFPHSVALILPTLDRSFSEMASRLSYGDVILGMSSVRVLTRTGGPGQAQHMIVNTPLFVPRCCLS